jgi:hypothetical protein
MRRIIFSVTTVILIAAGVSIGSRIQASSHSASVAGAAGNNQVSGSGFTLSPQEFMVKLGRDLPSEKWDSPF